MFVVAGNIEDYHNRIDSNYFGFRPPNIIGGKLVNGADIIMVGYSTDTGGSSNIIEYNYFEECKGEDEIISTNPTITFTAIMFLRDAQDTYR